MRRRRNRAAEFGFSPRCRSKDAGTTMTNRFHEANRHRWDAGSASWADHADTRGIWRKAHRDPSLALHAAELAWLRDIAGKKLAVLGSGDNQVVFALAGMGAVVTSVDISEQQIEIARSRAAQAVPSARSRCKLGSWVASVLLVTGERYYAAKRGDAQGPLGQRSDFRRRNSLPRRRMVAGLQVADHGSDRQIVLQTPWPASGRRIPLT